MSSGGDSCVTVGYRYFAGLHLVFCHGLDALLGIRVGEKWAWTGSITANSSTYINKPELFGGESREGGIRGTVDTCFGLPGQPRNSYLQSVLGTDIPAFRGLFALVARKCLIAANNPYIKEWSVLGRRTRIGWRDDLADIVAADGYIDMNPAHIIYETLTNSTWGGMGYPTADLDDASFQTAANLLNAEGFGLSLLWAKNTSVEDFLKLILDHIDGKLYYSHITGLLKLKLVRNDYNIGALPVLNEGNIIELVDYTGPAATEAINQVVVGYVDRDNNPCSVTVQDPAGITRMGGQINTASLDFVGIADGALASKVAARELQQLCQPIASCTLIINRKQSLLEPGDCFNFSWGPLGIENMAMRVDTVDIGLHTDSSIRIVAVRDVYGLGAVTLTDPADSLWTNPLTEPANAIRRKNDEITWWQFVQQYGESAAVLAELDDTSTMLTSYCGRPSSDALNYELWTRNAGATDWIKRDTDSFPFTGTLAAAALPEVTSVLQLQESTIDTDLVKVGTYAALGDELVAVTAIDPVNLTVTVNRGVLDTVPVAHDAGEYLWCHQGLFGLDQTDRAVGESVEVRVLPSTSQGRLALEDAPTDIITTVGRMMRPYPPGNVLVNGSRWPISIGAAAELAVTWAHRSRLLQTVTLARQDDGNIGPEAGTTYTMRIYHGANDALLRTVSGLSGTAYTYPAATEITDGGGTLVEDPYWANVVLALPMDGANGSTTFTDISPVPKAVTRYGNAQISTVQSKFGGASAYFDGNGDYLTIPHASDLDLSTGDFTIELWAYFNDKSSRNALVNKTDTSYNGSYRLEVSENILAFYCRNSTNTGWLVGLTNNTFIQNNTWHHIAAVRCGNIFALYCDGAVVAAQTITSGSLLSDSNIVSIGWTPYTFNHFYLNGYIDDLRITKGVARYTANFTPPRQGVSQYVIDDTAGLSPSLRFELESVRDGLTSYQKWDVTVPRT